MKTTAIGALATLAGSPFVAAISQVNNPAKQEKYTSGAVMDGIMAKKYVSNTLLVFYLRMLMACFLRLLGTLRRLPALWTQLCTHHTQAPPLLLVLMESRRSSPVTPTTLLSVAM